LKKQNRFRSRRTRKTKPSDNEKGVISFFTWWFAISVFWISLTGIKDYTEILFGLGIAILPGLLQNFISARGLLFFLPGKIHFSSAIIKLPLNLIKDNYLVLRALILERIIRNIKVRGNFKVLKFQVSDKESEVITRSAVYTYGISLIPNTYVIGIDKKKGTILIHELVTHPRKKELPL